MNTPKYSDGPFPHLRFEGFFPESTYQKILQSLPPIDACHELRHRDAIGNDNHSTRLQFGFAPWEFHKLPLPDLKFWAELLATICNPDVTDMVRHALQPGMERRFGSKWCGVKLKPVPWLIRDRGGYRIGVHPDHQGKVITLQIYLPSDDSQASLGTVLYRQSQPLKHAVELGKPAHDEDQDKFEPVHQMEFLPNTGYAFVVLPDSWHGVNRVDQPDGKSRDSLMIHYIQS
jgi:hypothetical protein